VDSDVSQGEAVLAEAVGAYRAAFGSRLAAAYALGSLAHGGFSPLVSDVDLGLILRDPGRPADRLTVRRVARSVRAGGPVLHQRLSVFWGTPSTLRGEARGGRFPPLDRLDLLEYGRLLTGQDTRDVVARPSRGELLVAGAEFALGALGAELVAAAMTWRGEPPAGDQAAALLARDLLPLYLHYLDDHTARLDAAGRPRLAARFRRWRARLLV
jgi:predicted nucleotidyltransferase